MPSQVKYTEQFYLSINMALLRKWGSVLLVRQDKEKFMIRIVPLSCKPSQVNVIKKKKKKFGDLYSAYPSPSGRL
jgi:hypothetical protein